MSEIQLGPAEIDYLLTTKAIRERADKIFDFCQSGETHFEYNHEKLDATVSFVLETILKKYPDLKIPYHSRWGHFRVGGIDRVAELEAKMAHADSFEKARIKVDLVVTSVLLDAGAGMGWKYTEAGREYSRSEGLGVASFHLFMSGKLSADGKSLRADAEGLGKLSAADLEAAFQVTEQNPLVGIEGRLALLNNLQKALSNRRIFATGRPGDLIDYLARKHTRSIPATGMLRAVLEGFGSIWPGRLSANGLNLGDVWHYSPFGPRAFKTLIPIHKLSQWMTYSLIEPIEGANFPVSEVEELTGLAEYRNGGLMLDSELLTLRDPSNANREWAPDSDLVIEWRALTIHLLDRIGEELCRKLNKTPREFPLGKALEGGTWWAGRALAQAKRADAGPPLKIKSDGTVF